jgi:hypothetical protein
MQAVTLLIAAIASSLVFFLAPIYGLVVYIASFAWYPTYIAVPVGTVDFTVRRIVILAIFAKLFLITDLPKRFRFIWLDKLVIIYFAAQFLVGATTATALSAFFENRAGAVFDTILPYFAVRLILRNRQQYLTLLKWILIIATPLAIIGFYECMTGTNLVGFFQRYNAWGTLSGVPLEEQSLQRYGFFRAFTVFSQPIMYGLFFAMFGPVCAGIMGQVKKNRPLCWLGLGLMAVGIFSSMSSGPLLAVVLSIPFIAFYPWHKYWRQAVILIIIMCASVEIISNRHFYEVIDRFAFSAANAWYRSKLIRVALFEGGMSGHWLFGYPFGTDPGWGKLIGGRGITDIVNHYLGVLCHYGLVGLIPFLTVIGAAIKRMIDSFRACVTGADRWLVWCLSGALFGILGAMNSTSLFGPPVTVFYIMLACCGTMPNIVDATKRNIPLYAGL